MTEREEAIREVLAKRADCCREAMRAPSIDDEQYAYYQGKMHGYFQAIELLEDTLESIRVEL